MKKIVLAIFAIIILSGCTSIKVKHDSLVNITYTVSYANGTFLETGTTFFRVGSGMLIKGVEEGVINMSAGGTKTLVIPPEKAYGQFSSEPIYAPFDVVNNSVFTTTGINADVGVIVFVITSDDVEIRGLITDIQDGVVEITPHKTHPLQGETLVFEVTVNSIE